MTDVAALHADDILKVPPASPEKLFSSAADAKKEYRALARRWHPDVNAGDPDAARVFAHVNAVWNVAEQLLAQGMWNEPNVIAIKANDGRNFRFRYRRHHEFELGDLYLGHSSIGFAVREEFDDLVLNSSVATKFVYDTAKMEEECSRYLPTLSAGFKAGDRTWVIYKSTRDLILAKDLLAHAGGKLAPKHVAWIVSALLNIACYLEWARKTHNAISLDTVLVSPKHHTCCLFGGWWYSRLVGAKTQALPTRSAAIAHWPADVMPHRPAGGILDLDLIRLTALELLGDPVGTRLAAAGTVPAPMLDWLRYPGSFQAKVEYARWHDALKKAFGGRRFVEMPISPSDVYGKD